MKLIVSILFLGIVSLAYSQQQQGIKIAPKKATVKHQLKKENLKITPSESAPAPGVNQATESNRKRPGATVPSGSNSKSAPVKGGSKEAIKKD